MPKFPGFIGGSYTSQSPIADAERTVNLYVEQHQVDSTENAKALYPTPGFQMWTPLSTVGDVGARGSIVANGRFFQVLGGGFYDFDVNGTPTKRGPVAVDQNPAQLVFDGVVGGQIGIASGGSIYSFDVGSNTLSAALLTGNYSHLAFAGGFGLAFQSTTGKVVLSALNDLSTWNVGTFFRRSLFADPAQAMFVDANNLVWLVGTDTFEVWYNTGQSPTQPWAPLSGLQGRYGIAAPFAYAVSGSGNFWLARNPEGIGQFVLTSGSKPNPVSTYAVNTAISGYLRTSTISDAEVLLYQQEGHTFANVAFPSVPATWSFDVEGTNWCERGKWNPTQGRYDLWAPRTHAFAFGKHLIGDRATGSIFQMDTTLATEIDGSGIRRLRRAPGLIQEHQRIAIDDLEILMDVGLGVPSGQGSDPKIMLRVSQDGGRTYSNERQASVGRIGEYRKRVYWTRLGVGPHSVMEISYSEPTPFRLVDAWVNNFEKSA